MLLPRKHKSFPFLQSYKLIQHSFISSKLMMKVEILQGNHKIFCSGLQKTEAHFMNDHSTTDRNLYTDSVFALFSDKAPNKTSQFLHICKCLFFTKEKKRNLKYNASNHHFIPEISISKYIINFSIHFLPFSFFLLPQRAQMLHSMWIFRYMARP